ncbi:MAG TPA: hypothetical protein VIU34_02645 [Steroidobacter sp.]
MFRTNLLLTLVVSAACVTSRPALAEEQAFASSAVLLELKETRSEFSSLKPYEQSQVYIWLLANCGVDADTRRMDLMKLGSFGELALIEAFGMGPPVAFLAELAASRRNDFAAIQERLAGEDREMFDDYLREQVKAISEDSYVNDGIDLTILSYRLSALDGIATVGTNTSIAWLERTSPKLESPELRLAAERALEALRKSSKT